MAATAEVQCSCASEFQDREYGAGRRLANLGKFSASDKKDNRVDATCTVCGKTHSVWR